MSDESNWDSYWRQEAGRSFWHEPAGEIIELRNRLDKDKTPDVLDFGCGAGRHALLFAESGFDVTAVDFSRDALEILRVKTSAKNVRINIFQGNYSDVLFPEASFDLVIAYNVLYHGLRKDFRNAVQIISGYLRTEGLLFFTCPTRQDAKYGNGEKIADNTYRPLNSVHPGDIHYFADKKDIQEFLSDFSSYSSDVEEHYWDNNGIQQFNSTRQILANK